MKIFSHVKAFLIEELSQTFIYLFPVSYSLPKQKLKQYLFSLKLLDNLSDIA